LVARLSFAVETAVATPRNVDLVRRAKSLGFEAHLVFGGINSPEKSLARIRNRVARGGHGVPDDDVRRPDSTQESPDFQKGPIFPITGWYIQASENPVY
jgi:predicted ABC-type ATPase